MRDLWLVLDDLVDNEMIWRGPGPDADTAHAAMAKTDELLAELVAAYLETEDEDDGAKFARDLVERVFSTPRRGGLS
jgi:hypothetical protein